VPKSLGVINVLVSGQPSEHRLPQRPYQHMPAVLACAGVGEPLARHCTEAERVVEFRSFGERGLNQNGRN